MISFIGKVAKSGDFANRGDAPDPESGRGSVQDGAAWSYGALTSDLNMWLERVGGEKMPVLLEQRWSVSVDVDVNMFPSRPKDVPLNGRSRLYDSDMVGAPDSFCVEAPSQDV